TVSQPGLTYEMGNLLPGIDSQPGLAYYMGVWVRGGGGREGHGASRLFWVFSVWPALRSSCCVPSLFIITTLPSSTAVRSSGSLSRVSGAASGSMPVNSAGLSPSFSFSLPWFLYALMSLIISSYSFTLGTFLCFASF
ncbi:hypothetical protein PMAYCL1PPCAC_11309, partial [Pristionchus mayeri]